MCFYWTPLAPTYVTYGRHYYISYTPTFSTLDPPSPPPHSTFDGSGTAETARVNSRHRPSDRPPLPPFHSDPVCCATCCDCGHPTLTGSWDDGAADCRPGAADGGGANCDWAASPRCPATLWPVPSSSAGVHAGDDDDGGGCGLMTVPLAASLTSCFPWLAGWLDAVVFVGIVCCFNCSRNVDDRSA